MVKGKFHYRDGLHFERLEDGSVRITYPGGWIDDKRREEETFVIEANSWASIVAHVSHRGATAETFPAALIFHNGG